MPRKTLNESSNDPQTAVLDNANESTSILIFISAKALGSLGFAVSLLAIWFGWLLPASITAPAALEELDIKKLRLPSKHPRRSRPNGLVIMPPPTPMRRASAPVNLPPILTPRLEEPQGSSRRVYFSDLPHSPIIRRNTMPESKNNPAGHLLYQAVLSSANGSPGSSTSTLPTPGSQPSEYLDEAAKDSDSSPQSSKASLLTSSCRMQKLKLGFNVKSHRPEPLLGDQASIISNETAGSEKSARRASGGGFVASWTLSRNRTAPDVTVDTASPSPSRLSFARRRSPARPATSPATAAPVTAEILSPTFLSRKAQKRISAPIPRTSPYGAPYFATPPLLLNNSNNYPAYLKGLPQFEDEVHSGPAPSMDSEDARGRTSTIRRVNLNPAPTSVHKRRSASEDWTQRQSVNS